MIPIIVVWFANSQGGVGQKKGLKVFFWDRESNFHQFIKTLGFLNMNLNYIRLIYSGYLYAPPHKLTKPLEGGGLA